MTLVEASAIWVEFKGELKFVCENDLYLDMNTRRSKELLDAILLLEDVYVPNIERKLDD